MREFKDTTVRNGVLYVCLLLKTSTAPALSGFDTITVNTSLADGFTGSCRIVIAIVGAVVTDVAVAAESVVVVDADFRDRIAIVMTV